MMTMAPDTLSTSQYENLRQRFGSALQLQAPLARLTAARVGGMADALLEVSTLADMIDAARLLWEANQPFIVLGGGSNVLVSDRGVRGAVLINRARQVRFSLQDNPPLVRAESGANFGALARQAAQHGLAGLEWAAGIPGTIGGAIVGNAGANGGDMAGCLLLAEILHRDGKIETWAVERLAYSYRTSILKRELRAAAERMESLSSPASLVLSAVLQLDRSTPQAVQQRMDEFTAQRRRTQPPGASMGSMFKNPPGDYAGRLIEAAGLKGLTSGAAQISPLHANFFINLGQATAQDIWSLITIARQAVADQFGVKLELEIELVGEWTAFGQPDLKQAQ